MTCLSIVHNTLVKHLFCWLHWLTTTYLILTAGFSGSWMVQRGGSRGQEECVHGTSSPRREGRAQWFQEKNQNAHNLIVAINIWENVHMHPQIFIPNHNI